MNKAIPFTPLLLAAMLLPAAARAQLAVDWQTIDVGGQESRYGGLILTGTIGQHDGGEPTLSAGNLELTGGFWPGMSGALCPADFNFDGFVDDTDFVVFAQDYDTFLCSDPGMTVPCPADFNLDGFVDDSDFVIFAAAYDQFLCP